MADTQNYSNHTRWYPLFHFVLVPLLALNFFEHAVRIYTNTGAERWEQVFWTVFSFSLILLALAARLMALKAQDRVIRLEERLRYRELLSPELAARASDLPVNHIIALRFASDGELSDLVTQVLDGKLKTSKEIKMAIKDWRADYHRV
ncbi:hypothetical protein BH10ACI3_BH10ACI3_08790 [soil metagenome]